jgi:small subunit ribosomal protein S11
MKGRCYITQTKNNIFVLFTESEGKKVLVERSSGKLGFSGAGKRTRLAAEMLGREVGKAVLLSHYTEVVLYIRGGVSALIRGVVSGLGKSGLNISEIVYVRSIAHNGVRPKKKRRV